MILEEKLLAEDKLPSTSWLSENLKVPRNVILEAYAQLMAEGYVKSKSGSGTIVSKGIHFKRDKTKVEECSKSIEYKNDDNIIDFRSGIPNLELFPKKEWGRLYNLKIVHSQRKY